MSGVGRSEIEAEVQARLRDNPFYVLELAADCSRAEVERSGQKLLAMLELELSGSRTYPTPFGPGSRDDTKVREAMAELRDPTRRLFHELWVLSQPWGDLAAAPVDDSIDARGFGRAHDTLGWR